jgi:hypothetical protein
MGLGCENIRAWGGIEIMGAYDSLALTVNVHGINTAWFMVCFLRPILQMHLSRFVTKLLAMALLATAVAGWASPDHESP